MGQDKAAAEPIARLAAEYAGDAEAGKRVNKMADRFIRHGNPKLGRETYLLAAEAWKGTSEGIEAGVGVGQTSILLEDAQGAVAAAGKLRADYPASEEASIGATRIGDLLCKRHKFDEAEAVYTAIVLQPAGKLDLRYAQRGLAVVAISKDDFANAARIIEGLKGTDGRMPIEGVAMELGAAYRGAARNSGAEGWDEAIRYYRMAADSTPEVTSAGTDFYRLRAQVKIIECCILAGYDQQAVAEMKKASSMTIPPGVDPAKTVKEMADIYIEAGMFDRAEAFCNGLIIADEPLAGWARTTLAGVKAKRGEGAAAAEAVAAETTDAKTLVVLAGPLREQGEYRKARELYQQAVAKGRLEDYGIRARVALAVMDVAEGKSPADTLADCNSANAAFAEAEEMVRRCYERARYAQMANDANTAKTLFRQAAAAGEIVAEHLSTHPGKTPETLFTAANVYGHELGDHAKGARYYQMAAEMWPEHEYAGQWLYQWVQCARMMWQANLCSQEYVEQVTEQAYRAILEQHADEGFAGQAAFELGEMYAGRKQYDEAIELFKTARARASTVDAGQEALANIARAYKQQKKYDEAIAAWQEWLGGDGADFPTKEDVVKEIAFLTKKKEKEL